MKGFSCSAKEGPLFPKKRLFLERPDRIFRDATTSSPYPKTLEDEYRVSRSHDQWNSGWRRRGLVISLSYTTDAMTYTLRVPNPSKKGLPPRIKAELLQMQMRTLLKFQVETLESAVREVFPAT
jgi:hypothetical protein